MKFQHGDFSNESLDHYKHFKYLGVGRVSILENMNQNLKIIGASNEL